MEHGLDLTGLVTSSADNIKHNEDVGGYNKWETLENEKE